MAATPSGRPHVTSGMRKTSAGRCGWRGPWCRGRGGGCAGEGVKDLDAGMLVRIAKEDLHSDLCSSCHVRELGPGEIDPADLVRMYRQLGLLERAARRVEEDDHRSGDNGAGVDD